MCEILAGVLTDCKSHWTSYFNHRQLRVLWMFSACDRKTPVKPTYHLTTQNCALYEMDVTVCSRYRTVVSILVVCSIIGMRGMCSSEWSPNTIVSLSAISMTSRAEMYSGSGVESLTIVSYCPDERCRFRATWSVPVSYTHLTLPTIYSV